MPRYQHCPGTSRLWCNLEYLHERLFCGSRQETTLRHSGGGTVTCKQAGTGLVSGPVGKQHYQDCIDKAHSDGYQ